eukprot:scaffold3195_cov100-Isochrysis_galbana.AAC.9
MNILLRLHNYENTKGYHGYGVLGARQQTAATPTHNKQQASALLNSAVVRQRTTDSSRIKPQKQAQNASHPTSHEAQPGSGRVSTCNPSPIAKTEDSCVGCESHDSILVARAR